MANRTGRSFSDKIESIPLTIIVFIVTWEGQCGENGCLVQCLCSPVVKEGYLNIIDRGERI